MLQKNPFDEIRCINPTTGAVQFIRRWVCEDVAWQNATGFIPQPIENPIVNNVVVEQQNVIEPEKKSGIEFELDGDPFNNDEITMYEIQENETKRRGRPKKS
jgi:hypothetical protein